MTERAKALIAFRRAAKAALEAGEPIDGLRALLTAVATEHKAEQKPARFDRPGHGE